MATLLLRLSDVVQAEPADAAPVPLAVRDAALLAWLAIEGPTARESLGALLWPASSGAQARTTLRQRLFQLRRQLGRELALGSPLLALAPGIEHDLHEATELLGGLSLPDAPEFDAWLTRQRERRRQREIDGLRAQAQALEDAGDALAALPAAQALLQREPLSEVAHQRVIRLLYLAGDRAAALAAFDACEQLLKDELGTRPSPETLALLATVEKAQRPLAARTLRALPAAVLRPPRMVGRERELAALVHAWEAGQVPALTGEAGMGKSRLLAEFIEGQPGLVRAAGRPGDGGVPFATLARLLRAVGEPAAALQSDDVRSQLARVMPELGAVGTRLPESRGMPLQSAIVDYLEAVPRLNGLVLDDLHFADVASLEMLQSLVPETRTLRWVLAYRPADAGTALKALEAVLGEAASLAPVAVVPLPQAALAELVDQLDLGIAGSTIASALMQRTGGNPLFVLETLKQAWIDQRIDSLAEGGALPRPLSVDQLIDRRINQLSVAALALARVASIAGDDFSIGLAEEVLDTAAIFLADALNELESAQVLRGTAFAHDLVFDAVRRSVPQALARHAHGRVARWLERHDGEPARIARHWVLAEENAPAITWLKRAAEAAAAALRAKESGDFLIEAAALEADADRPDDAFDTLALIVERALHSFIDDPLSLADRMDRVARTPANRIKALATRSGLLLIHWRLPEAIDAGREAVRQAETLGDPSLLFEARHALAPALADAGDPAGALALYEQLQAALAVDPGLDPAADLANNHAIALERAGRVRDAIVQYNRHADHARQSGQWSRLARTLGNLSISHLLTGHVQRAHDAATEGARLFAMYDEPQANTCGIRVSLAALERLQGCWRTALAWLDEVDAVPGRPAFYGPSVQLRRASIWLDLAQFARASTALAAVASHPAVLHMHRLAATIEQARLLRWSGQDSVKLLADAQALLPTAATEQMHTRLQLALERARHADDDEAGAILDDVQARARALGMEGLVTAVEVGRAQRAVHTGGGPAAARAADRAAAALALVPAAGIYLGEAWLWIARAYLAGGAIQRAHEAAAEGAAWVHARVGAGEVPSTFVESYLHRHPFNTPLLALANDAAAASRLG